MMNGPFGFLGVLRCERPPAAAARQPSPLPGGQCHARPCKERGGRSRTTVYLMTRFEQLRRQYPVFRYEGFQLAKTPARVTARFRFSIPPDIAFSPEVHFEPTAEAWHTI